MIRAAGSGLYGAAAEAAEELWAAVLVGARTREVVWADVLDNLFSIGRSGLTGRTIQMWYRDLAAGLGLSVASAQREIPDTLGDVSARLADGSTLWFELKTQTQKRTFGDLTQADWVRDATTGTAWLCANEPRVSGALSPGALRELIAPAVPSSFGLDDAWLSDLLLLTDGAKRLAGGATDHAGMEAFAHQKFLLHTTHAGARVIRMSELRPIAALLAGQRPVYDVHHGAGAAAGVWITAGHAPSRNDIHFSYNLDYGGGVLGRHKLHGTPLATDPWLVAASVETRALPAIRGRGAHAVVTAAAPPTAPAVGEDVTWGGEASTELASVQAGDRVRHRSRGLGRIRSVRVLGATAEVEIQFDRGDEGTFATGFGLIEFGSVDE